MRPQRADSEQSRERLLMAGLRLFAQRGFAQTSIREIAEAAQVNVASISYYFGDKAGLYRAVFFEPLERSMPPAVADARASEDNDLGATLRVLFEEILAPLSHGEMARLCIQLHFREMVEPTGLWAEEIDREIRPMHEQLLRALHRHFEVAPPSDGAPPDAGIVSLALSIAGLAVHLHVAGDVIESLAPDLRPNAQTVPAWIDRLTMYAHAMVDAEGRRRAASSAEAA